MYKKRFTPILSTGCLILLFATACMNVAATGTVVDRTAQPTIPEESIRPSQTTPTLATRSTLPPTQPPLEMTPTAKNTSVVEIPTEVPTPDGEVIWANGIDAKIADGLFFIVNWRANSTAVWSPVRNEIILPKVSDESGDSLFERFSAPDFQAQEIRVPSSPEDIQDPCWGSDILWSQDGQRLFFTSMAADPGGSHAVACSLWMVEHDGSSPRLYQPVQQGQDLSIWGWIDDHTMITDVYHVGFQMLDLLTGKIINRMYAYGGGPFFFTRDYFVGTDGSEPEAFAFGRPEKPLGSYERSRDVGLQNAKVLALRNYNLLDDVRPGTNRVLIYQTQEQSTVKTEYKVVQKLVEWDIDRDTVTDLLPYAIYGRYSPDQRTLAYLTYGPADLDDQNRPKEVFNKSSENEPYLQLFDLNTRTVFLSVPIVAQVDYNLAYHGGVNFSPDDHYMAILSTRKFVANASGWPDLRQPQSEVDGEPLLSIFDMQSRKLVWSQKTTMDDTYFLDNWMPAWSPKSDQFTYLNDQGNIVLVNLTRGTNTPLTRQVALYPKMHWSYDGAYLYIQIPKDYNSRVAFLKVP